MKFDECVMHCFDSPELVEQFNRLYGCKLGVDQRTPIDRMIDQATGNPGALDQEEARQFIEFVHRSVWIPLMQKFAGMMSDQILNGESTLRHKGIF